MTLNAPRSTHRYRDWTNKTHNLCRAWRISRCPRVPRCRQMGWCLSESPGRRSHYGLTSSDSQQHGRSLKWMNKQANILFVISCCCSPHERHSSHRILSNESDDSVFLRRGQHARNCPYSAPNELRNGFLTLVVPIKRQGHRGCASVKEYVGRAISLACE